ncbi:hypothetical protein RMQ97_12975 [Maricaulis sp. D1M11]|uniref:hypothetical protein n=1 Tax=Maricaulis sp. D1M11 TaxID=3076117 RepID=UPI0039B56056
MSEQLTLDLPIRDDFSPEAFVAGAANADARAALTQWRDWPRGALLLCGPAGAGKTHMAAIWARMSQADAVEASDLEAFLPDFASDRALVVENADRVPAGEALFHVLNRAMEDDMPGLLLTARVLPALWTVTVPDLVSRLKALPVVDIHEPDDDLLSHLLEKQLMDRGTAIDPGVIHYLLPRIERSVEAVRELVDRLDKCALVNQTPINRTVARTVLAAWDDERNAS